MKLEKTVTTEILSYEKDEFKADLRVGLLNGEYLELCHASITINGKIRGMLKYEDGMFICDEEEATDFLDVLSKKFRERYNLEIPSADEIAEPLNEEEYE